MDLSPQSKPQKITIEFSSSTGPVSVYVFKESDAKGQEGLETAESNRAKALVTKQSKEETFAVDVPENTAIRVIFVASKKTDVTARITNR